VAPTKLEAQQFALMVQSGLPQKDVIQYFFPDETDSKVLLGILKEWLQAPTVATATLQLMGKAWQEMTNEERILFAIDKHYNEMATFLYSHNYCELVGNDRQKADICRAALEAKIAGTAGKLGPIESFWHDIKTGKVKLAGLPA